MFSSSTMIIIVKIHQNYNDYCRITQLVEKNRAQITFYKTIYIKILLIHNHHYFKYSYIMTFSIIVYSILYFYKEITAQVFDKVTIKKVFLRDLGFS